MAAPSVGGLSELALEHDYVHQVYEHIAPHFSDTRHSRWPGVSRFLRELGGDAASQRPIVLDIGCGNGKYLEPLSSRPCAPNDSAWPVMVGCDRSQRLLDICSAQGFSVVRCDGLSLPFADRSFDAAISIAVIHHFATPERRLQAVHEMVRVIRRGGRGLIAVWAFEQAKASHHEQDVFVPWHLKPPAQPKAPRAKQPPRAKRRRATPADEPTDSSDSTTTATTTATTTSSDEPASCSGSSEAVQEPLSVRAVQDGPCIAQGEAITTTQATFQVYQRYYHLFREGELQDLVQQVPDVTVLSCVWEKDNWHCVFERRHQ